MRIAALSLALIAAPALAAPVDVGPANVPAFKPAFAGQTRAEAVKTRAPLAVTEIAGGLNKPWALTFLPDGRMLVTEKAAGSIRIVGRDGAKSAPLTGTPKTDTRGQGGMFDVALAPDFTKSATIFWSYAEPREGGTGLAVARGRLVQGAAPRVEDVKIVFRMLPTLDSTMHYGGRLRFAPDGKLFIAMGERSILPGRMQAQDLGSHFGKIARINADGSVPKDNPFVGKAGARPEIWSSGHRNIQSAALDAKGRLWEVEMGPQGGDELNLVAKAKDYGWPTIGYGEEYSGKPVGKGITAAPGLEQPVYYWDPVIAPSGMTIHSGKGVPEWQGNIFIGGLKTKDVVRLVLRGDRVVGEERLVGERGERIREVREGPDGALYLLTDASDGKLLRFGPR